MEKEMYAIYTTDSVGAKKNLLITDALVAPEGVDGEITLDPVAVELLIGKGLINQADVIDKTNVKMEKVNYLPSTPPESGAKDSQKKSMVEDLSTSLPSSEEVIRIMREWGAKHSDVICQRAAGMIESLESMLHDNDDERERWENQNTHAKAQSTQEIRPIDATVLWNKIRDVGGCGATPNTYERGWDDAILEALRIIEEESPTIQPIVRAPKTRFEGFFLTEDSQKKLFDALNQVHADYLPNMASPLVVVHEYRYNGISEPHSDLYGKKVTLHLDVYAHGAVNYYGRHGKKLLTHNNGFRVASVDAEDEGIQNLIREGHSTYFLTTSYEDHPKYTGRLDWQSGIGFRMDLEAVFGGWTDENKAVLEP